MDRRHLLFLSGSKKPVEPVVYPTGNFFLNLTDSDLDSANINSTPAADTANSIWVTSTTKPVTDDYCGSNGVLIKFAGVDENLEPQTKPRVDLLDLDTLISGCSPSILSIDEDSLNLEQTDVDGEACIYSPNLFSSGAYHNDTLGFTWASDVYINSVRTAFKPTNVAPITAMDNAIGNGWTLRVYNLGTETIFTEYDSSFNILYSEASNQYYWTIPVVCTDADYATETSCGIRISTDGTKIVDLYVDNTMFELLDSVHSKYTESDTTPFIKLFENNLWICGNDTATYGVDLDPELVYLPTGSTIQEVGWAGPALTVSDTSDFECTADSDPGLVFASTFWLYTTDSETHLILSCPTYIDNGYKYFYAILGNAEGDYALISPDADEASVTYYLDPAAQFNISEAVLDITISTTESFAVDNVIAQANSGKMFVNIFISQSPVGSNDIYGSVAGGSVFKVVRLEGYDFRAWGIDDNLIKPEIHRLYGLPTANTKTLFKNM